MDRLPPWSYTFLNTYRSICPHQAYRRYVLRDQPTAKTDAIAYGNWIHDGLARRIAKGTPLPAKMAQYEPVCTLLAERGAQTELKLGVTKEGRPCGFSVDQTYGRGAIDVVTIKGTKAFIVDWKTGKKREDPFELQLQAYLLSAKYPDLTQIGGHYFWCREMQPGLFYDLSDTAAAREEVYRLMYEVTRAYRLDDWPKNEGPLCGWCSVRDCEYNRAAA